MVKRFLITTAVKASWRSKVPVLFLGEWCIRDMQPNGDADADVDAQVVPYHWDDRQKLDGDYVDLQVLYEQLLREMTKQLNDIHGVDKSERYWRILIGPWLGCFIPVLFDRWTSLAQAVNDYNVSETVVVLGAADAHIANGMAQFERFFVSDQWNHALYGQIIEHSFAQINITFAGQSSAAVPRSSAAISSKRKLAEKISAVTSLFTKADDGFIITSYLPFIEEAKLHLKLGQSPQVWCTTEPDVVAVDQNRRKWTLPGNSASDFESCARDLIAQNIPIAYLEGYAQLQHQISALSWPQKPKFIWTSNSFNSDDVFKAWTAEKVEQGAPLIIGQHGGHYGVGRRSFLEDHEVAISDAYLSWGWSEAHQPKVKPVGQLKAIPKLAIDHGKNQRAMMVTATLPQQSYILYSAMISRQWLDYFNDQCLFVSHLPQRIRDALTVRLYSNDYDWDQVKRWRGRFPQLSLDQGQMDMMEMIKTSRLYIATYNATTYLESFVIDIPTVMFWNPQHWELRDSAIPHFEALKRVGIFHQTPQSAAEHVAKIWDDVDAWWHSEAVRQVLTAFKQQYCATPTNLVNTIRDTLLDVMPE